MGLILDLAVVVVALVVVGSLALLAWTLAINAVRATRLGRRRVEAARKATAHAETRLRAEAERTTATLTRLSQRTSRGDAPDT